jgi:hypothetical protein
MENLPKTRTEWVEQEWQRVNGRIVKASSKLVEKTAQVLLAFVLGWSLLVLTLGDKAMSMLQGMLAQRAEVLPLSKGELEGVERETSVQGGYQPEALARTGPATMSEASDRQSVVITLRRDDATRRVPCNPASVSKYACTLSISHASFPPAMHQDPRESSCASISAERDGYNPMLPSPPEGEGLGLRGNVARDRTGCSPWSMTGGGAMRDHGTPSPDHISSQLARTLPTSQEHPPVIDRGLRTPFFPGVFRTTG